MPLGIAIDATEWLSMGGAEEGDSRVKLRHMSSKM
jgi:hypothetical protein